MTGFHSVLWLNTFLLPNRSLPHSGACKPYDRCGSDTEKMFSNCLITGPQNLSANLEWTQLLVRPRQSQFQAIVLGKGLTVVFFRPPRTHQTERKVKVVCISSQCSHLREELSTSQSRQAKLHGLSLVYHWALYREGENLLCSIGSQHMQITQTLKFLVPSLI